MGHGLLYGFGALAIAFIVLLFVPKAFSPWRKFGIWFIPLVALVFIFYPAPGAVNFFLPPVDTVFQWVSCLYLGICSVIIATAAAKK